MKNNVVFRYSYRVENKRHVRKKQVRTPLVVITMAGIIFFFGWLTLFSATDSIPTSEQTLAATKTPVMRVGDNNTPGYSLVNIDFPSQGQAAIGTLENGVLQATRELEKIQPMASMTKVITALAILKKAPIVYGQQGDMIVLDAQDEKYYWDYVAVGGTVTAVTAGLEISQYDAIQAMLLPSSNNIADTLVDEYFSSRDEYFQYANAMIREFGLEKTTVADASGFSANSVSTPSEMIVIGQKTLENPILAAIVTKPKATIAIAGEIPNYNALIEIDGVTGIKPGFTDEAGRCLLFSANTTDADGKTVTIIGVVMGIDDFSVYVDGALTMLDQAKKQLSSQST